jgi:hypothetical protein
MMNPFDEFKKQIDSKLEEVKYDVRIAVETALLRSQALFVLSG